MRRQRVATDWTDDAEHDPGVALIELLAYAADILSRHQDQVAAEARRERWRRYVVALGALAVLVFCRLRRGSAGAPAKRG